MPAAPLPENLPYAFRGEAIDPRLAIDARRARRWQAARNPTGQPNADVLRQAMGVSQTGRRLLRWVIDFPQPPGDERRRLYHLPFATLPHPLPPWKPDRALRTALARLDRYLAAPAGFPAEFAWIESTLLPDDSLAVWARDDDYSAGVLNSRLFAIWRKAHGGDPLAALRSFPFPWPPGTPLGSLTREQEERRHAIAKAARAGDCESVSAAVLSAYRWRDGSDEAMLAHLRAKHTACLSSIR